MTFRVHLSDVQPSLKQLRWESAPLSLRLSGSTRKGQNDPAGASFCFKWKSLSVWESCSWLMEEWSRRKIKGSKYMFAVIRTLLQSDVIKKKLSQKAKLLTYWSIYISTSLTWDADHDWKNEMWAADMSFFCRLAGLSLRIPPGWILLEVFLAHPTGKKPWGKSRCQKDYSVYSLWPRTTFSRMESVV